MGRAPRNREIVTARLDAAHEQNLDWLEAELSGMP
jgi:hypothetical protein